MASAPDVSDSPGHPSSSSPTGSATNSGSGGLGSPFRYRDRSESRESSPCPLIIEYDVDPKKYRMEQALRAANNTVNHGNAVSHPSSHDSSFSHGTSASDNGDGEDMSDEEFFAQFNEEVPDWVREPADAEPQVQGDGSTDLLEEDLEAQLDSELGAADGNVSMDILDGDLEAELDAGDDDPVDILDEDVEAQLDLELGAADGNESMDILDVDLEAQPDTELAGGDDDETMDILDGDLDAQLDTELAAGEDDDPLAFSEDDFEAQLNAELEAEAHQEVAEAARHEAVLQEATQIAAERAAPAVAYNQGHVPSLPAEKEPLVELNADGAVDGLLARLSNQITVMSELKTCVNQIVVKRYYCKPQSKKRPKKRAKTAASKSPDAPPMRRTDELPRMYHRGEPDWDLLRKHMNLSMYYPTPVLYFSPCGIC